MIRFNGRYKWSDVGKIGARLFWRDAGEVGSSAQLYVYFYDINQMNGDLPGIVFTFPESLPIGVLDRTLPGAPPPARWPSQIYITGQPLNAVPTLMPMPKTRLPASVGYTWGTNIEYVRITITVDRILDYVDFLESTLIWGDMVPGYFPMPATLDMVTHEPPPGYVGPPPVPPGGGCENLSLSVPKLVTAQETSVALMDDGTLWGWGKNDCGQLGLPSETLIDNWSRVPIALSSKYRDVIGVACGNLHTMAVTREGDALLNGYNVRGQCGAVPSGDGKVWTPTYLKQERGYAGLGEIVDCQGGEYYTVVLNKNGDVYTFGDNQSGQLGIGTVDTTIHYAPQCSTVPPTNPILTNVRSIAVGRWHAMAMKNDGTLWAWGNDAFRQLGLGPSPAHVPAIVPTDIPVPNVCVPVPTQVTQDFNYQPISGVTKIACGQFYSLFMKTNGSVHVAGSWPVNQLSSWPWDMAAYFQPVEWFQGMPIMGAAAIIPGTWFAFVVYGNGTMFGWGMNDFGQLGIGYISPTAEKYPKPVQVGSGIPINNVIDADCHDQFSLARLIDGSVWSWGSNAWGRGAFPSLNVNEERPFALSVANAFHIDNRFPNNFCVFEDSISHTPTSTTVNVWICRKSISVYPATTVGFIEKGWNVIAHDINPVTRARENLRSVYVSAGLPG